MHLLKVFELHRRLEAIVIIVLFSVTTIASAAAPRDTEDRTNGVGNTISGTVTDAATGDPIQGALICFTKRDTLGNPGPCVSSDATGNFMSDPMTPEPAYVAYVAQATGYSKEAYDDVPWGSISDAPDATPIDLSAASATGIDFALGALPDPATVNGLVTDADTGLPVAGAFVSVGELGGYGTVASGTTDASGLYSIEVPITTAATRGVQSPVDRTIVVEAASPDHAPTRFGAGPVTCYFNCDGSDGAFAVSSGSTTSADLQLSSGSRFEGSVVASADAGPIQGARIEITDAEGRTFTSQFQPVTDAAGVYQLPFPLPAGTYFLKAVATGQNFVTEAWDDIPCEWRVCPTLDTTPLVLDPGATVSGVDFDLDAGAVIEASVSSPGRIFAYNGAGRFLGFLFGDPGRIEGLEGGSYYLDIGARNAEPYLRQLHNGEPCPYKACSRTRGEPLNVPPGGTLDGLNYELVEGGQIDGRVIDAATGETPAVQLPPGFPIVGSVDLVDAAGVVWGAADLHYDGVDVKLTSRHAVPPGQYYLRTYDTYSDGGIGFHNGIGLGAIPGYSDQLYDGEPCKGQQCDLGAGTPISFSAGSATNVTIELQTGSSVSGSVVDDASGDALGGVTVKLVDSANETLAATMTDDNGVFELGAFPAGSYYLRTSASGQPGEIGVAEPIEYFDKVWGSSTDCSEALCEPANGTAIALDGANDAGPFELRLTPGPTIRGRIIDQSTGLSIDGGSVDVFTDAGQFVGTYGVSPFDGHFQTTALSAGTYTLVPEVSSAYVLDTDSLAPNRRNVRGRASGFGVVVGETSVEADTAVAENYIFGEGFE